MGLISSIKDGAANANEDGDMNPHGGFRSPRDSIAIY